jgi:chromosomal replication initiator protein
MVDDVRSLEGALVRVVAFASLTGRALEPAVANEVLDRLEPRATPAQRSVTDVQAAIAAHFQLTLDELRGGSRAARVSWPRQLAMFLARELTDATLPAIGREFGGRDHSTVVWACRKTDARLSADQDAATTAEALRRQIVSPRRDRPR